MTAWKKVRLTGWGRNQFAPALACRPERARDVAGALRDTAGAPLIARGAGRSYGDVAINAGGRVVLMERLDRLIEFDPATGDLVCEAGVTFRDLFAVFLPRGFLPPVCPGTAFVTVGGAIANDVHGKNHERAGSFGDHVRWLDLLMASGEIVRVAPHSHPELFAATIGGIGLTGVILQACIRLVPTASNMVELRERRIPNLEAFLAALLGGGSRSSTYSVGWIDGLARGGRMGRGILQTAEIAAAPSGREAEPKGNGLGVPVDIPSLALNPLSIAAFNELYYRRVPAAGRSRMVPIRRFFFPLDRVLNWNRIYGKRGFSQFQCVIPTAEAERGIARLVEAISSSRTGSFLAVIKALGRRGQGCLSFAAPGCTLALDFPQSAAAASLLTRLERITLEHGGRINLAKDSSMSAASFAAMYPELPHLRSVLGQVDPAGRFGSSMSRRLHIHKGVC